MSIPMREFRHAYARDLEHAAELLRTHGAQAAVVSGGSDLLAMMKERLASPALLVNLQRVPGIDAIGFDETSGLRIGAMATLRALAEDALVARRYGALSEAAGAVASPQIRNVATIGGNLAQRSRCWYYRGPFECWLKGGTECPAVNGENKFHAIFGAGPCHMVHPSDLATALLALDAAIVILGPRGRRSLPVSRFYVDPSEARRSGNLLEADELIAEVLVPAPAKGARSGFVKAMERAAWDAAIISIAYSVVPGGEGAEDKEHASTYRSVALALGGVATTPLRAPEAERLLAGRDLTPEALTQAAEALARDARPLSQNAYKIPLLKGYLRSIFDGAFASEGTQADR